MANNYCEFSVFVPCTKEQAGSFYDAVDRFHDYRDKGGDIAESLVPQWLIDGFGGENACAEAAIERSMFDTNLYDEKRGGIYVYCEDGGDADLAATFLHAWLKHEDMDTIITMSVSWWCDRPREDEFGGVGLAISKEGVRWGESSHEQAERLANEIERFRELSKNEKKEATND